MHAMSGLFQGVMFLVCRIGVFASISPFVCLLAKVLLPISELYLPFPDLRKCPGVRFVGVESDFELKQHQLVAYLFSKLL